MSIKTTIEHNGLEYTAHVATIKSTSLGTEGHGIFTASLQLEWDHSGIVVGGYCLDNPDKDDDGKHLGRIGTAFGLDHIIRIIETAGVQEWEQLKGSQVFVLFPGSGGWGSSAVGIANLSTGKPLIFKEHADAWHERESKP